MIHTHYFMLLFIMLLSTFVCFFIINALVSIMTLHHARLLYSFNNLAIYIYIYIYIYILLHSESSTRCSFRSTVTKLYTHFEHSFLLDECSCKMGNTLPSGIFNSSAISCNFNLRSGKARFWIFLFVCVCVCFPGQLLNLGDLSVKHHLYFYDRV